MKDLEASAFCESASLFTNDCDSFLSLLFFKSISIKTAVGEGVNVE